MQKSNDILHSKVKRLVAAYIDLLIAGLIGVLVFSPITDFITANLDINNRLEFNLAGFILALPSVIIFSFKDFVYGNASIGKHLFGLKIVSTNGKKITYLKLFLRNCIFSVTWPIESVLILLNNKRLGDYVFKTTVVEVLETDNS